MSFENRKTEFLKLYLNYTPRKHAPCFLERLIDHSNQASIHKQFLYIKSMQIFNLQASLPLELHKLYIYDG